MEVKGVWGLSGVGVYGDENSVEEVQKHHHGMNKHRWHIHVPVSTEIIVFWGFYSPFPDIVLFYVKFIGGGIGIENVYDDDQFCTFGLHCGLKRTVLFQGTKDE